MSMNRFMHAKNIYRDPPDFEQMSVEFDDIRKFSKINIRGKVYIDFGDENAVRTLTQCLLKRDFNLDVRLPQNKLIPTLPLRLNYILWIEDMAATFRWNECTGIDIGCGASCIYGLLAVRRNPTWKMWATEVDASSLDIARINIDKNNLRDDIHLVQSDPTEINAPFSPLIDRNDIVGADFTVCNPPFFNENDLGDDCDDKYRRKNRTGHRKRSKHAKSGIDHELYTSGGEVEYVKQMIRGSKMLCDRIKVFTSMLGHKTSVPPLLKELKSNGIFNFASTEFCQGNTTRWGIAWTFRNDLLLRTVPCCSSKNPKEVQRYTIEQPISLKEAHDQLVRVLNQLERTTIICTNDDDDSVSLQFVAESNSWSQQRRKRRAERRPEAASSDISHPKRMKGDSNEPTKESNENSNGKTVYLHLSFILCRNESSAPITVSVQYLNGSGDIDSSYQLIQFIRNKWNSFVPDKSCPES